MLKRFAAQIRAALFISFFISQAALAAPRMVSFSPPRNMPVGSIYVSTGERALYLMTGSQEALRYPVAVGRAGKAWSGEAYIASKHIRPDWSPPPDVRADHPELPDLIPGGHPSNPMGEAALVLNRGSYAIHGTNNKMRRSIGTAASYGCIRMYNEDILDLYDRVDEGTLVVVH